MLKDIGVSPAHRRKLLRAIAELAGTAPTTRPPADSAVAVPQHVAERRRYHDHLNPPLLVLTGVCGLFGAGR
jgi:hypothetical protein